MTILSEIDVITNSSSECYIIKDPNHHTARELENLLAEMDEERDHCSGMGGEIEVKQICPNEVPDLFQIDLDHNRKMAISYIKAGLPVFDCDYSPGITRDPETDRIIDFRNGKEDPGKYENCFCNEEFPTWENISKKFRDYLKKNGYNKTKYDLERAEDLKLRQELIDKLKKFKDDRGENFEYFVQNAARDCGRFVKFHGGGDISYLIGLAEDETDLYWICFDSEDKLILETCINYYKVLSSLTSLPKDRDLILREKLKNLSKEDIILLDERYK